METHFKILVCSNIRRKKPWSRIEWIGHEKESVCLIDRCRASVLYLPSGHTKRVIDVFKPHKKKISFINTSSSGEYVVACLQSGDILRWHKDSNSLSIISACPDFTLLSGNKSGRIRLFISNDGCRIVSIFQKHKIYVWEQTRSVVEGEWTSVGLDATLLNVLTSQETAIDGGFFNNLVQGQCFLACFAFTSNLNVNLCLLLLEWCDDIKPFPKASSFVSSMSRSFLSLQESQPARVPLKVRGCYVPRLSHDGHMLALAVNQLQPHLSSILFVDVYRNAAILTNQQHIYVSNIKTLPNVTRSYWVKMMSWSYDDLYLYCITGRGSVLVYNKVGQPMMSSTHGLDVELGPSFFLPLHPLVQPIIDTKARNEESRRAARPSSPVSMASTLESERSLKQKFSVTTHPRLPIVLCSDGYMVTALQMTTVVTSYDIAALSLVEINHEMKILIDKFNLNVECSPTPRYGDPIPVQDEAKFKEYKYTRLYLYLKNKFKRKKESKEKETGPDESNYSRDETFNSLAYEFEKAENELVSDTDADSGDDMNKHPSGIVEGADQGKVTFGDLSLTFDEQLVAAAADVITVNGESLLKYVKVCAMKLLHAFVLLLLEKNPVPTPDSSSIGDKLQLYFIDSLRSLCDLVTAAQEMSRFFPWSSIDTSVGDSDNRWRFGDLIRDFAKDFAFLVQFSRVHLGFVTRSTEVVVEGVLRLRDRAPEGCYDMEDVQRNIAVASRVLFEVEHHLNKQMSLHSSLHSTHLDKHQFLDVTTDSPPLQAPFRPVLPSWVKLYSFVSTVYTKLPSIQSHASLHKLMKLLQSHLPQPVLQPRCDVIGTPITLTNMANNLMTYQLNSALILASYVLHDHMTAGSKWSESGWKAVDLLCDVMTLYFTKKLIIFPSPTNSSRRKIFLHSEIITAVARVERLSKLWNVSECVRHLLLCGRLREASCFSNDVGSWKAALCIAAVIEKVRAFKQEEGISPTSPVFDLLKARFKSLVPSWTLRGEYADDNKAEDDDSSRIDDDELSEQLFDYQPDNSAALFVDLFVAGVMTGYDVAVWGASEVLAQLKKNCRKLSLIEDDSVYLPSPPFYLPQPSPDQNKSKDIAKSLSFLKSLYVNVMTCLELDSVLRHKISTLLRVLLILFHSAGAMHHLIVWYGNKLKNVKSDDPTSAGLSAGKKSDEILASESSLLASVFRETCAILWLLHAREKLTMAVREFQKKRDSGESAADAIEKCLMWCSHMKPFARYLDCEVELHQLVLCLCSEKAVDRLLVAILAYYFCESEKISPKIQTRFSFLMQKLRQTSIQVKSKHGGPDVTQPLSVTYQKICRVMLQKQRSDSTIQNLFVRSTEQLRSNESLFNPELTSVSVLFCFEQDDAYHYYMAQLFDVISAKSDALIRGLRREGISKFPTKILVVGNRHVIAVNELKQAMTYMEQRKYPPSAAETDSFLPPSPSNISKSILKVSSRMSSQHMVHIVDSVQANPTEADAEVVKSISLRRFFSDLLISEQQSSNHLEIVESIQRRLQKCNEFEIADIFPSMQKRFYRLLPYVTWLQYWSERDVANKSVTKKPSMRVGVTRQQLLQSLFVAEIRFGGYSPEALNGLLTSQSNCNSTLTSISSSDEPEVKKANVPIVRVVEASDTQVKQDDFDEKSSSTVVQEEISDSLNSGTMDGVSDIVDTEEKSVAAEETIPKEIVSDSQQGEMLRDRDESSAEVESSVRGDSASSETPPPPTEKQFDELADGGSPRTRSARSPRPTRPDIASVVQSEIQNVLLAQQVSLLSQILLGQTMVGSGQGAAQMSTVADILSNLQGLRSQVPANGSLQTTSDLKKRADEPDENKENTRPPQEETLTLDHLAPSPSRGRKFAKQQNRFDIPLLHVPGISKSYDPSIPDLIKTPKSKQAWAASSVSKGKQPSPIRESSPPPKLIRSEQTCKQLNYKRPVCSHLLKSVQNPCSVCKKTFQQTPIHREVTPHRPAPPPPPPPPPPPACNRIEQSRYKTAFPILNKPVEAFVPVKPVFHQTAAQQPPSPCFFPQQSSTAPRVFPAYPPAQRPFYPTLIDPREVIGYHSRKQGFTSVKPQPAFKSIKPLPMLLLPRPKTPEKDPEKKLEETQPVKVEKVEERKVDSPKAELPEFKGYLDQEKINAQVQQMVDQLSGSADRMSEANAHFIAAVGKQIASKPRMVDASEQAQTSEKDDEDSFDVDYKEKLTTKPLQPPPDIFDKMRKEIFSPTKTKPKDDFIDVGDTSIDAVTRGLPHKPMSVAELHYRSSTQQPLSDLTHLTGFPDRDQEKSPNKRILTEQIESASRVAKVREVTRERWTSAMKEMSAQLNAMDAMARDMDADFKNATKLYRAVEEGIPAREEGSKKNQTSPRASPQPEPDQPRRRTFRNFPPVEAFPPVDPPLSLKKIDYKDRLRAAFDLASPRRNEKATYCACGDEILDPTELDPAPTSVSPSAPAPALGDSFSQDGQSSAPDDDISLLAAQILQDDLIVGDDAVDDDKRSQLSMGVENQMQYDSQKMMTSLSRNANATDFKVRPWNERTESEKQEVRDWMRMKQRERTARYTGQIKTIQEKEANPFRYSSGCLHSTSSLQIAAKQREERKRRMLSDHMLVRLTQSKELLNEMNEDISAKNKNLSHPLRDANGRGPVASRNNRPVPYEKKQKPRPRPRVPLRPQQISDDFDNASNASVVSAWSLSDDVKRILYGPSAEGKKKKKPQVTFNLKRRDLDEISFDRSDNTSSLINGVDWASVDDLVASVDYKDM